MTKRMGRRRSMALTFAMLVTALVPATASAGSSDGTHCVFPDGTDFNEIWGVTEAVVWFNCTTIGAGEDWRVAAGWGMNSKFQGKRKGFVSAGATPLADFLAKFVGVKVVVDAGTASEQTYRFTDTSRLLVGDNTVNAVTMGVLPALPVGQHIVDAYWTMSAMHCDGFPRPKGGCLPAGDSLGFSTGFEVVTPQ
jgi:hypothetical protein